MKRGYQQTEIGILPADWEVRTIEEIATVRGGKRLPLGQSLTEKITAHPYIRVTDMRPGGIDLRDIKFVPDEAYPAIKNYRIFRNDIFISVAGTLGIVGTIPAELDGANLTENADRITDISCDQDFLLYQLMSQRMQSVIESVRTVGAQPKLALGQIESFLVGVPRSVFEQRAIAEALGDVDALLGALDAVLAKKRDLKQAAMQQLLTGQTRLPGFSGEWDTKRLGDLLEYQQPTPYLVKSSEYDDSFTIPVLTAGKTFILGYTNEEHGVFRSLPAIIFDDFTTSTQYVDFPFKAKSSAMKILLAKNQGLNLRLIYQIMQMIDFQPGEHKRHWISEYQKMTIKMPSDNEQSAIATILSDMDAELAALEARRAKTQALKQGMMQELLTGRTRLV